MIGAGEQAGGGQQQPAWIVGNFQWSSRRCRRDAACCQQDRPARGPVLLGYLGELVADQRPELLRIVQDLSELGYRRLQLVAFRLELDPAESSQPAERHFENVVGLYLGKLEHLHQPRTRIRG